MLNYTDRYNRTRVYLQGVQMVIDRKLTWDGKDVIQTHWRELLKTGKVDVFTEDITDMVNQSDPQYSPDMSDFENAVIVLGDLYDLERLHCHPAGMQTALFRYADRGTRPDLLYLFEIMWKENTDEKARRQMATRFIDDRGNVIRRDDDHTFLSRMAWIANKLKIPGMMARLQRTSVRHRSMTKMDAQMTYYSDLGNIDNPKKEDGDQDTRGVSQQYDPMLHQARIIADEED